MARVVKLGIKRPAYRPLLPDPEPREAKYTIISVDDHLMEAPHAFEGRLPANSAFAGAPIGELATEDELTEAAVTLEQLLPTGGRLAFLASADRLETDGRFSLLSPSYGTRAGVEFRQPLLRDRSLDAARFRTLTRVAEGTVLELGLAGGKKVSLTVGPPIK